MPLITDLSRERCGDSSSFAPDLPADRGFLMGSWKTQGLVQVYTGTGKGKTTAATGLIVRALGQGMRVLLVRFLKPDSPLSGEISFLGELRNLEILTSGIGVVHGRPDPEKVRSSVVETFSAARTRIFEGDHDMVVFDE
ncbi:MAG: cob(I)yrinic acid a,c-diamide adenosyltransferase, partial [Desulfuromonadales bacterium]